MKWENFNKKKGSPSPCPKRKSRKPCYATKEELDLMEGRILQAIKAPTDAEIKKMVKQLSKSAESLKAAVDKYRCH